MGVWSGDVGRGVEGSFSSYIDDVTSLAPSPLAHHGLSVDATRSKKFEESCAPPES